MIAAASTLFTVAWLALVALLLTTTWLAWRWSKVRSARKPVFATGLLRAYTWPIMVVSSSTWQSKPEAQVAQIARLSAAVAAVAGAALLLLMAVAQLSVA
jgi:hypothetical protein